MKIIFSILLFNIGGFLFSTTQVSDRVIFNDKRYYMEMHWGYGSPLSDFFYVHDIKSPFRMASTANYRGFIAVWEIIDSQLYLRKITMDQYLNSGKIIPVIILLEDIFYNYVQAKGVKASWFSGKMLLKEGGFDDNISIYMELDRGDIITSSIIAFTGTDPEMYNFTQSSYEDYFSDNSDDYFAEHRLNITPLEIKMTNFKIKEIYDKYDLIREEQKKEEERLKLEKAQAVYQHLPGYKKAMGEFKITSVNFRHGNFILQTSGNTPDRIDIRLTSLKNSSVNIRWLLPIVKVEAFNDKDISKTNYEGTMDWNAFLTLYRRIYSSFSRHEWLVGFMNQSDEHTIQFNIDGNQPYIGSFLSENDFNKLVEAPWSHGGLAGNAKYEISISSSSTYGTIYIGDSENNGLMVICRGEGGVHNMFFHEDLYEKDVILKKMQETGLSWYELFNFKYHPSDPQYLIVTPEGNWSVNPQWKPEEKLQSDAESIEWLLD